MYTLVLNVVNCIDTKYAAFNINTVKRRHYSKSEHSLFVPCMQVVCVCIHVYECFICASPDAKLGLICVASSLNYGATYNPM